MIRSINQCSGKRPFKTKEDASKAASHLNQLGGKRMTVYKCSECNGYFHLGHNTKGNKLSPNDDMKRRKITHVHEPGVHKVDISNLKFKRK